MIASRIRAIVAVVLLLAQAIGPLAHHAFGHRDDACSGHAHCAPSTHAPDLAALHTHHSCPTCDYIAHASVAMDSIATHATGAASLPSNVVLPSHRQAPRSADVNISSARAPPR